MDSSTKKWMIYGVNGYTGLLIAEEAVNRNFEPILAGRNPQALLELSEKLNLPARVFDLSDIDQISENLLDVDILVNCAGPFSQTAKPFCKACLRTNTHYLDITGEFEVFEFFKSQDARLKKAGIIAIPGIGFDVVPSDCLAAKLKKLQPDSTSLTIAMKPSLAIISPGTAKTMVEGIARGSVIRKNGQLVNVSRPKSKMIPFGAKPQKAINIQWGDVSSAFFSTGIPNIEIYLTTRRAVALSMKFSRFFRWIFLIPLVVRFLQYRISSVIKGPTLEQREKDQTLFWGEVKNPNGKTATLKLKTPNGYSLTVDSTLKAVEKILDKDLSPGYKTPSMAFGPDFVDELKGIKLLD